MSFQGRPFRPRGFSRPYGHPMPKRVRHTPRQSFSSHGDRVPLGLRDDYVDAGDYDRRQRSRSPNVEHHSGMQRDFTDAGRHPYDARDMSYSRRHEHRGGPVEYTNQRANRHSSEGLMYSEKDTAVAEINQSVDKAFVPPSLSDTVDRSSQMVAVEKAKEMAQRTREIMSKLGGFKQIAALQKTAQAERDAETQRACETDEAVPVKAPESSTISRLLQNNSLVKYAFNLPIDSEPVKNTQPSASLTQSTVENQSIKAVGCEPASGILPYRPSEPDHKTDAYPHHQVYSGYQDDTIHQPEPHASVTKPWTEPESPTHVENVSAMPNDSEESLTKAYDPTIANILKSIGFNFELSHMMQEKARQERVTTDKSVNDQTDLSVQTTTQGYGNDQRPSEPSKTKPVTTVPVCYEEMASKYREEQRKQYGEPVPPPVALPEVRPSFGVSVQAAIDDAASDFRLKYKALGVEESKKPAGLYEDFSDDDDFNTTAAPLPNAPISNQPVADHHVPLSNVEQLSRGALPSTMTKTSVDLDWELSTQEFIRKLQQPRQPERAVQSERTVTAERAVTTGQGAMTSGRTSERTITAERMVTTGQAAMTSGRTVKIVRQDPPSEYSLVQMYSDDDSADQNTAQKEHVKMMKTTVPLEELRTIKKTIIVSEKCPAKTVASKADSDADRKITTTEISKDDKPVSQTRKVVAKLNAGKSKESKVKGCDENASKETSSKSAEQAEREVAVAKERQRKIENLLKELENLRRQQNELMRRKKREKDGHKDPILIENSKLQEEISNQICLLKKATQQLTGIDPSLSSSSSDNKVSAEEKLSGKNQEMAASKPMKEQDTESPEQQKASSPRRQDKTPEGRQQLSSPLVRGDRKSPYKRARSQGRIRSPAKRSPNRNEKASLLRDASRQYRSRWDDDDEEDVKRKERNTRIKRPDIVYEYFDGGNHFCRCCNFVSSNVFEHCQHLLSTSHQQNVDQFDKPWLKSTDKPEKRTNTSKHNVISTRIKGVEFLMATQAFYCSLCDEFCGSSTCAETHFKSETHNKKYMKYLDDNTFYERRLELEKSAAAALLAKLNIPLKLQDMQDSPTRSEDLAIAVEVAKARVKRLATRSLASISDEPLLVPPQKKSRVVPKSTPALNIDANPVTTSESSPISDVTKLDIKIPTDVIESTPIDTKSNETVAVQETKSQPEQPAISRKKSLPFIGKLPKFKTSRGGRSSATDVKIVTGVQSMAAGTPPVKEESSEQPTPVVQLDVKLEPRVCESKGANACENERNPLDRFLSIGDPESSASNQSVPVMTKMGPPSLSDYLASHHDNNTPENTHNSNLTPAVNSDLNAASSHCVADSVVTEDTQETVVPLMGCSTSEGRAGDAEHPTGENINAGYNGVEKEVNAETSNCDPSTGGNDVEMAFAGGDYEILDECDADDMS